MSRLRFVSLFAGIGGFDLAFEQSGHMCVGQCEIDPHARSVLDRHWPTVPKHDDVMTLTAATFGPADVVTFGSPCQDLSVAGNRAGLDGARSGLFLQAVRYIREMLEETHGRFPRWAVWENVPGAYSSSGGADFAAVLESLVGGDVRRPPNGWPNAGVAFGPLGSAEWRTLNSQYFGVAQRRRRVFLVYRPGSDRAGEVLLEPDGLPGHTPSGREAGEGVTGPLEARTSGGGFPGTDGAISGHVIAVAPTVTASWGHHGHSSPRGDGTDPIVSVAVTTGTGRRYDAETETLVPIAFEARHYTRDQAGGSPIEEHVRTLTGRGRGDIAQHVAFALRGRDGGAMPEVHGDGQTTGALRAAVGGSTRDAIATTYAVRRLLPIECERLQGFPDEHTRYDAQGREIADTNRYKMLGNAVTVPVVAWIARRITRVPA